MHIIIGFLGSLVTICRDNPRGLIAAIIESLLPVPRSDRN